MEPVKLSVRTVVELVMRCGDIDSRYVDSAVMVNGTKAHKKIQKSMGKNYKKEVPLSVKTEMAGIPIIMSGRADGIITGENGEITIDEIKSTTLTLEQLYQQREIHISQAKCYAYMLFAEMENPPKEVSIQLTYYQLDTEELQRHVTVYTKDEIDSFFCGLMEKYSVWIKLERDWKKQRDESIKLLEFPFENYRKGQRKLAVAVYRMIEKQKRMCVQAPTGTGKTLSTLFPSIKAVGEGKAGKLFYLTAKNVTGTVAVDSLRLMQTKGLRFKSVMLRAKNKICFCEETICNPDSCEFAKGHFDRVNDALLDMLAIDVVTPEIVIDFAAKHHVCPYELSLDMVMWADAVICDYNYVFDPVAYLRRAFYDERTDYVFLIDEAHNLTDRVREMYSAKLAKSAFYKIKTKLKDKNLAASKLKKSIAAVDKYLLEFRKSLNGRDTEVSAERDKELATLAGRFVKNAEEWLAQEQRNAHPLHSEILELYFESSFFLGISELYDECYMSIAEVSGSEVTATLFCIDPSKITGAKLGLARSAVLFSATLSPLEYYREIFGCTEEDWMMSMPSPFEQGRLLLAANYGISTKFADREDSIKPISDAIYIAISQKRGNYFVYFPSYSYMQRVYDFFAAEYPDIKTILQKGEMSEDERAGFLAEFNSGNDCTLLGFCVLGGVFSEGIDLKGDRLIGTVIVGVGLPGISLRQDLIRDYFTDKNGRGYDYAYVFPGMNKVMQAAGRVIRSEEDSGLVLLIDSRYRTAKYRDLYPPWWSHIHLIGAVDELKPLVKAFEYFDEE